ncbi:MAG: hypothetical protein ACPGRC_01275 [Salibacteraceae bacterium]
MNTSIRLNSLKQTILEKEVSLKQNIISLIVLSVILGGIGIGFHFLNSSESKLELIVHLVMVIIPLYFFFKVTTLFAAIKKLRTQIKLLNQPQT